MQDGRKDYFMGLKILGTGYYLPETIVTNEDYTRIVETSDEWIVKRTGMKERRITEQPTHVMAERAALKALENAHISPEELDMILCTTVTSDYITPSIACIVQGNIGAKNAIALDINAACAAFVYAMDMAHMYLQHGYKKILIISAEGLSKITDYTDRSTCVLFGDAAGACIVGWSDKGFASVLGSDGTGAHTLFARRPLNDIPFVEQVDPQSVDHFPDVNRPGVLYMDGREVYKFAVGAMSHALRDASVKFGTTPEALDIIVPHQANLRIIQSAAKDLGLPVERFFVNIDKCGNTSSACIPVGLAQLDEAGELTPGKTVGLVGFGAGLVYGGCVFEL